MKIACLFPGYGAQFVGMAKELYDEHRIIQEYFDQASHCLDLNFIKLCFASSDIEIGQMHHAYPAVFLVSCALYGLLKEQGFYPDMVAGFNQGEYGALYAAKSFSFPDGLYLLSKYASFYQQAFQGMTASLTQVKGLHLKKVTELCKKIRMIEGEIFIAMTLSDMEHIVSGATNAVDEFRKIALSYDDVTVDDQPLEVGLHSSLMDPVVDQLKMYLEKVDFKNPQITFMNGINGKPIQKGSLIKRHILNNISMIVRWDKIIHNLAEYDLVVQVGPGSQLADQVQQRYPDKKCISINKKTDLEELRAFIATHSEQQEGKTDDNIT